MRIGSYDIDIIETCRFALDGGAMFGVVPKNLWSRAYPHVDEQNRIEMAARALLIRGSGRVVVVDAGCGRKMGEKLAAIYALDHERYTLEGELQHHGIRPDDVTDFIYTHLHFDHAGGSTLRSDDGSLRPTFPNARHYVQKEHLTWARNPTDKDRASFMAENWEPVVEAGLMEVIDGPGELFPGIELRLFHGHTRGMQAIVVHGHEGVDGAPAGLVYPADLMPTAAHVPFPYIMGYDNFPLTTLDEKKAFLPEVYERRWAIALEHDAYARFVRIESGPKGFVPVAIAEEEPA